MDSVVSTAPDGRRMQNTHRNSGKGKCERRTLLPGGNQAVLRINAGKEFAVERSDGYRLVAVAIWPDGRTLHSCHRLLSTRREYTHSEKELCLGPYWVNSRTFEIVILCLDFVSYCND